ncbi:MAG: hypothetical protein E6K41_16770, partial [Gammaproteobacteria bacterium]
MSPIIIIIAAVRHRIPCGLERAVNRSSYTSGLIISGPCLPETPSPWRYAFKEMMNRRPAPSEPCPWGLLALIFLSWAARVCSGAESLVLVGANVYTADDRNPRTQAVVAAHGRILYVGANADALRRAPPGARRMDMHGLTILPGLTDSHAHLAGIGFRELSFNLEGTASVADLKDRLRERAKQGTPGEWLTG